MGPHGAQRGLTLTSQPNTTGTDRTKREPQNGLAKKAKSCGIPFLHAVVTSTAVKVLAAGAIMGRQGANTGLAVLFALLLLDAACGEGDQNAVIVLSEPEMCRALPIRPGEHGKPFR